MSIYDWLRIIYGVPAVVMALLLLHRSRGYKDRTGEFAYLHLMAAFLLIGGALTAYQNWGLSLRPVTPFNLIAITFGVAFLFKNPPDHVATWKERRADPPDWDSFGTGIGG